MVASGKGFENSIAGQIVGFGRKSVLALSPNDILGQVAVANSGAFAEDGNDGRRQFGFFTSGLIFSGRVVYLEFR
jgi:hypothetical protein